MLRYESATTGTIPDFDAGDGTITTDTNDARRITGTGTNFTDLFNQIKVAGGSMFLYIVDTNEVRKVSIVNSDESLILDVEATAATGSDWGAVWADLVQYSGVFVGGNGTIKYPNGDSVTVIQNVNFSEGSYDHRPTQTVDAVSFSTSNQFQIQEIK